MSLPSRPWLLRLSGLFVIGICLGCTGVLGGPEPEEAPSSDAPTTEKKRGKKRNPGNKRFQPPPDLGELPVADSPGEEADDGEQPVDEAPAAKPSPAPQPGPGSTPSPSPSAPTPDGITKLSDTKWSIERQVVDGWMANPGTLAGVRQRKLGYQLLNIGTSSDLWHVGLRSNDIVKQVNEHTLTSQTEALAAYVALQSANKLTVRVKRGEGHLTHVYLVE